MMSGTMDQEEWHRWIIESYRSSGFTHFQPEAHCKTIQPHIACEPLILPTPSLPRIDSAPEGTIPGNWSSAIACPSCGRVHKYLARDVHWMPQRRADENTPYCADTRCFSVESPCGKRECGQPVRFFAVDSALTEDTVRTRLRAGFYLAECEHGHSLLPVPPKFLRVQAERGPLWNLEP